jgi:hypothetical protein
MKTNKKPKWILLDQWHVDLEIKSDVPAETRKYLTEATNRILKSFIKTPGGAKYRIKLTQ